MGILNPIAMAAGVLQMGPALARGAVHRVKDALGVHNKSDMQGVTPDQATLSGPARGMHLLRDLAEALARHAGDGAISLEEIQGEAGARMEALSAEVGEILRQHGIELDHPLELTLDGNGAIRVLGDSPHAQAINDVLARVPGLSDRMAAITALAGMAQSMQARMALTEGGAQTARQRQAMQAYGAPGASAGGLGAMLGLGGPSSLSMANAVLRIEPRAAQAADAA